MARKSTENRGNAKDSPSHRTSRVESEMRELIASYLLGPLRGEVPGMISVTRVIISKDLRQAKVLITVMDPTGETGLTGDSLNKAAVESLRDHAYEIQDEINARLRMKYCPKLTFFHDDGFDHAMRVENILKDLADQRKSSDPKDEE